MHAIISKICEINFMLYKKKLKNNLFQIKIKEKWMKSKPNICHHHTVLLINTKKSKIRHCKILKLLDLTFLKTRITNPLL